MTEVGAGVGTGVGGMGVGAGVGVGVGTGAGAGAFQVSRHSPDDSEPLGSFLHWPVAELQVYVTGVEAGVGTGSWRGSS
jgi:hypothetical protein